VRLWLVVKLLLLLGWGCLPVLLLVLLLVVLVGAGQVLQHLCDLFQRMTHALRAFPLMPA
jgi:hypothetical protein